MKSHTWSKDDGSEWDISDIPEDMLDEANSKRQELLDVVAEADDDVLEKYFADEELTVEDIKKAVLSNEKTILILNNKKPKKVIVVHGKIINIVV